MHGLRCKGDSLRELLVASTELRVRPKLMMSDDTMRRLDSRTRRG